jgi:hypothetical protein
LTAVKKEKDLDQFSMMDQIAIALDSMPMSPEDVKRCCEIILPYIKYDPGVSEYEYLAQMRKQLRLLRIFTQCSTSFTVEKFECYIRENNAISNGQPYTPYRHQQRGRRLERENAEIYDNDESYKECKERSPWP